MNVVWSLLECKDHKRYMGVFHIIRRVLDLEEDDSPLPMEYVTRNKLDEKIVYATRNCSGQIKMDVLLLL